MKLARVQDYRRWLTSQPERWSFQPERIVFEDLPTLGSGEIVLGSPVTVLAGPNGVGKTTLLKAIWASFAPGPIELDGSTRLKLNHGKIFVEFRLGKDHLTRNAAFSTDVSTNGHVLSVEVVHLDAASTVQLHQSAFCSFDSLDYIINGVGPRVLTSLELSEVNYVARRDYRELKIYEIETSSGIAPFFEVSYGDDRYDSRSMGAGELAVLYLWWAIDRAEDSSLFLIEEPETFLSPASHEAISNFIIASAFDSRHCFIVTSHSAKVIAAIPDAGRLFLYRTGGTLRVIEGTPPPALLEAIGLSIARDTIFLVEDDASDIFLREILEKSNPAISRRCEIKVCDGHGGIEGILKKVGGVFTSVGIYGVFDGDMRGHVSDYAATHSVFLPGDIPIEVALRRMVENDVEALKVATGSEAVPAILFGLQGMDHHDWYSELCRQLGQTKAQLLPLLFRLWFRSEMNAAAARTLVAEIDRLVLPKG